MLCENVYKTFTHKANKPDSSHWLTPNDNHLLCTLSPTNLLPTVGYFRFLYVPSSSVKTPLSSQVGNLVFIPALQCTFQRLVHSAFLESIMLFSSCSKDSLYPASRCRATMELSPHPNDIWVRSLHMIVSCQFSIPIVKDAFLAEVVIRDIRNWFFQKPPLKLINLCLRWWVSDCCLVRLIDQTHVPWTFSPC